MADQVCGLIPVYNNVLTIERTVTGLREQLGYVIVVDDGSDDGTENVLMQLGGRYPDQIDIIRLPCNQGKGAAVQAGLSRAAHLGFSNALQVDADGQHDLADVPRFLATARNNPGALILGSPVFDQSIPAIRKYGRKLTTLMIALEAGSWGIPDGMCGYRVYPIQRIVALGPMSSRMSYDPEVVIRALWAGIRIAKIPTRITYLTPEEGGVSHFLMIRDNLLNIRTHAALVVQAPWRLLQRRLRRSSL